MKLLILLACMISSPVWAVGNTVIKDIGELKKNGFVFELVSEGIQGMEHRINITSPWTYDFGEGFDNIPFSEAYYFCPTREVTNDTMLIGADGTKLPLRSTVGEKGHAYHLSFGTQQTQLGYLEFCYYRGEGSPPMLLHIPVRSIIHALN